MHIHLPKPLHGWRDFVGEVGIIVLGVLIALGAEQLVQATHDHSEVAELRAAMRAELAVDRARYEQNAEEAHCMLARLDAIDAWAATAPPSARIANPERPFLWNTHAGAWDIAKTSPAAAQLPLRERLMYAGAYDAMSDMQRYLFEEQASWLELSQSLAAADQAQNRERIKREVEGARLHLMARQVNSGSVLARLDDLGIMPDPRGLTVHVDIQAFCRPFPRE
jgi:hypothetical protein